jgi:hypothetical protein
MTPKFGKRQIVSISLYDNAGKPKNEFAQLAIHYYAKGGVIDSYAYSHRLNSFVYRVKVNDCASLLLTEDCLAAVMG